MLDRIIYPITFILALFYSQNHFIKQDIASPVSTIPRLVEPSPQSILTNGPTSLISSDRTGGLVLISDGTKGTAREAAFELASRGLHVLVGVQSDADARSFQYFGQRSSSSKYRKPPPPSEGNPLYAPGGSSGGVGLGRGIEPIVLDLTSPASVAKLLYRIREIRKQMDRPLVGVVLNLADYVENAWEKSSEQSLQNNNSTVPFSMSLLDEHLPTMLRGSLRLIEGISEVKNLDQLHYRGKQQKKRIKKQQQQQQQIDPKQFNSALDLTSSIKEEFLTELEMQSRVIVLTSSRFDSSFPTFTFPSTISTSPLILNSFHWEENSHPPHPHSSSSSQQSPSFSSQSILLSSPLTSPLCSLTQTQTHIHDEPISVPFTPSLSSLCISQSTLKSSLTHWQRHMELSFQRSIQSFNEFNNISSPSLSSMKPHQFDFTSSSLNTLSFLPSFLTQLPSSTTTTSSIQEETVNKNNMDGKKNNDNNNDNDNVDNIKKENQMNTDEEDSFYLDLSSPSTSPPSQSTCSSSSTSSSSSHQEFSHSCLVDSSLSESHRLVSLGTVASLVHALLTPTYIPTLSTPSSSSTLSPSNSIVSSPSSFSSSSSLDFLLPFYYVSDYSLSLLRGDLFTLRSASSLIQKNEKSDKKQQKKRKNMNKDTQNQSSSSTSTSFSYRLIQTLGFDFDIESTSSSHSDNNMILSPHPIEKDSSPFPTQLQQYPQQRTTRQTIIDKSTSSSTSSSSSSSSSSIKQQQQQLKTYVQYHLRSPIYFIRSSLIKNVIPFFLQLLSSVSLLEQQQQHPSSSPSSTTTSTSISSQFHSMFLNVLTSCQSSLRSPSFSRWDYFTIEIELQAEEKILDLIQTIESEFNSLFNLSK